jgi:hypothetical protein
MAEFSFNATTNLEGGKECWYKVSRELALDCCVLNFLIFANQFLLWFLETLGLLGTSTARMPPEAPCCLLDEQHGIFGNGKEEQLVDHNWNEME